MIDIYTDLQLPLQTILLAGPTAGWTDKIVRNVFVEADERQQVFESMPFVNITAVALRMDERSINDGYYFNVSLGIELVTFDFTSFATAAKVRSELLKDLTQSVRENRQYGTGVELTEVAPEVGFSAGTVEGAGGFVAIATFNIISSGYVD